jgi:hypothetical protein
MEAVKSQKPKLGRMPMKLAALRLMGAAINAKTKTWGDAYGGR